MMTTLKLAPIAAAAMMLAACGSEKPAPAKEEAPEKLAAGLYELTSEVTLLDSTDKTKPATKLAKGDKSTVKACVSDKGVPAPELFAEAGDKCEMKISYVNFGRISAQMSCDRSGHPGYVMPAMMGSFKADSFEGEITTMTYFTGEGDYRMGRKVSAKRIGDCPAGGAEPAKAG
jgi:hypothetical protein